MGLILLVAALSFSDLRQRGVLTMTLAEIFRKRPVPADSMAALAAVLGVVALTLITLG